MHMVLKPSRWLRYWVVALAIFAFIVIWVVLFRQYWSVLWLMPIVCFSLWQSWRAVTLRRPNSVSELQYTAQQWQARVKGKWIPVRIAPQSVIWSHFIGLKLRALTNRRTFYVWVIQSDYDPKTFKHLARCLRLHKT